MSAGGRFRPPSTAHLRRKAKKIKGDGGAANGDGAMGTEADAMDTHPEGAGNGAAHTGTAAAAAPFKVTIPDLPELGSVPRTTPLIEPHRLPGEGLVRDTLSQEDTILTQQIKPLSRGAAAVHIKSTNQLVTLALAEKENENAALRAALGAAGIRIPPEARPAIAEPSAPKLSRTLTEVRFSHSRLSVRC
jgi:hypothetical protein